MQRVSFTPDLDLFDGFREAQSLRRKRLCAEQVARRVCSGIPTPMNMSKEMKGLKAFAVAAGADSVDNSYYCFEAPVPKTDEAEVRRLVQEAEREMGRLEHELPKDNV